MMSQNLGGKTEKSRIFALKLMCFNWNSLFAIENNRPLLMKMLTVNRKIEKAFQEDKKRHFRKIKTLFKCCQVHLFRNYLYSIG